MSDVMWRHLVIRLAHITNRQLYCSYLQRSTQYIRNVRNVCRSAIIGVSPKSRALLTQTCRPTLVVCSET